MRSLQLVIQEREFIHEAVQEKKTKRGLRKQQYMRPLVRLLFFFFLKFQILLPDPDIVVTCFLLHIWLQEDPRTMSYWDYIEKHENMSNI